MGSIVVVQYACSSREHVRVLCIELCRRVESKYEYVDLGSSLKSDGS